MQFRAVEGAAGRPISDACFRDLKSTMWCRDDDECSRIDGIS